jgi:hypothetical protein
MNRLHSGKKYEEVVFLLRGSLKFWYKGVRENINKLMARGDKR